MNGNMSLESAETRDIFDDLFYLRNGSWSCLPGWAKFYLNFGFTLSQFKRPDSRYIVALAIPSRSYASLLIASGIVYGRSQGEHKLVNKAHLEMLVQLRNGVPVLFRRKNRKFKAKKYEVKNYNGKIYIGLLIEQAGPNFHTIIYVPEEDCELIDISGTQYISLPGKQKGREIIPPSMLVQAMQGNDHISNFHLHTNIDAVIIGPKNILKEEMNMELATTRNTNCDCTGHLSDLLRAREFLPAGAAYRSSILAAITRSNAKTVGDAKPSAIIFDGPTGFMKWRENWKMFNWVVIIDKTDRNFDFAVGQVNNEYLARAYKQHKVKIPTIPTGVEMMYFNVDP
jgi:hypothetical protein